MSQRHNRTDRSTRRQFLVAAGTSGLLGLAGCLSDDTTDTPGSTVGQIGSGRAGRAPPGGTPVAELPALSGELTLYSGRSEFLVGDLLAFIENQYEEFSITPRYGGSTGLVNQVLNAGSGSPADVFYSVNAGALGVLTDEGRTLPLSEVTRETVRSEFRTPEWVGTSGRARSVPHNTNAYDAAVLPTDIMAYPGFEGSLGWAPSYGSCQAFVTAMRIIEGEPATRDWLEGVTDAGIASYPDEFAVCQAVADGEIDAGFANHYYIQRVLEGSPDAPIATAFTEADAGAAFNVAGAAVVDTADDPTLAETFIRHLLSAEAQDYFARSTFEYPLVPAVEPIGELPAIDELAVPDIDLTQLSELEPTVDLMRDAGISI